MKYKTTKLEEALFKAENRITDIAKTNASLIPDETTYGCELYDLGQEIKELTEGKNELIFDKLGRPNVMVNFKVNETARNSFLSNNGVDYAPSEGNLGVHPAFVQSGKFQGFRLGKYMAARHNNHNFPTSLRGMSPAHNITHDGCTGLINSANAGAFSNGKALHLETAPEVGYLSLLSRAKGFCCKGNSYFGTDQSSKNGTGIPCDDHIYVSGEESRVGKTLTGSGPASWNLDGTCLSPADLRGNAYEWKAGIRYYEGFIQVLDGNKAAIEGVDLSASSTEWKYVLANGTLSTTNDGTALGWSYSDVIGASKPFELAQGSEIVRQANEAEGYGGNNFSTLTAKAGIVVPGILKELLVMPVGSNDPTGYSYMRNALLMERGLYFGGYCHDGASNTGFGRCNGHNSRGYSNWNIGFRVGSLI
jgi:hypothetical protein